MADQRHTVVAIMSYGFNFSNPAYHLSIKEMEWFLELVEF